MSIFASWNVAFDRLERRGWVATSVAMSGACQWSSSLVANKRFGILPSA
jgi:hypothetical protein